jgi:predicted XRE-type DNA-binding protein
MTKTKTPPTTKSAPRATEGSANVFADLGLPNPEQELIKARLALQIYRIIRQRGLTQSQAASALGIKQPHVSLLMRNRAGSFSVGRLLEFLTRLGQDVEVTVRPTRREHGEMSVRLG